VHVNEPETLHPLHRARFGHIHDARDATGVYCLLWQFDAVDRATLLAGQQHNLDVVKLHACIKAQNDESVKASLREGEKVGVSATPTLFINGQELDGAVPINELRASLDRALQQAGVPAPAHPAASASPIESQSPSK